MSQVDRQTRALDEGLNWRDAYRAGEIYYHNDVVLDLSNGYLWRARLKTRNYAPPSTLSLTDPIWEAFAMVLSGLQVVGLINVALGSTDWQTGGSVSTNLGIANRDGDSLQVTSSTGAAAEVPAASITEAGLLTAVDKSKLDGIEASADANVDTDLSIGTHDDTGLQVASSTGDDVVLPLATSVGGTNLAGLFSPAEKDKLTGIEAGAEANVDTDLSIGAHTSSVLQIQSSTGTDVNLPLATGAGDTNLAGLFSPAEKDKLTGLRIVATADVTIYVDATDGDDVTGDGTSGSPFQTIQRAVDEFITRYDMQSFAATVQLADDTYASGFEVTSPIMGVDTIIYIVGNVGSPENVILTTADGSGVVGFSRNGGKVMYSGVTFVAATGTCIRARGAGSRAIIGDACRFGASAIGMHGAFYGEVLIQTAAYEVFGGAVAHKFASACGVVSQDVVTLTVTITGAPAITLFNYAASSGVLLEQTTNYVGTFTGQAFNLVIGSLYAMTALGTGSGTFGAPGSAASTMDASSKFFIGSSVYDGVVSGAPAPWQRIFSLGGSLTLTDGLLADTPQTAADVAFTPAGSISADDLQDALEELDAEKQPLDSDLTAVAALATASFGLGLLTLAAAVNLRGAAEIPTTTTIGRVPVFSGTTGAMVQSIVLSEDQGTQRVGILKDSPIAKLDVNGDIRTNQAIGVIHDASGNAMYISPGASDIIFYSLQEVSMTFCVGGATPAKGIRIWPTTYFIGMGDGTTPVCKLDVGGGGGGPVRMRTYTAATLPANATAGQRAFVSDSNATLAAGLGNIVAGGGANFVPVYSDGTNWRIG